MMSHHFNSMLEHLRIGALRKAKSTENENISSTQEHHQQQQQQTSESAEDVVDNIILKNVNSDSHNRNNDDKKGFSLYDNEIIVDSDNIKQIQNGLMSNNQSMNNDNKNNDHHNITKIDSTINEKIILEKGLKNIDNNINTYTTMINNTSNITTKVVSTKKVRHQENFKKRSSISIPNGEIIKNTLISCTNNNNQSSEMILTTNNSGLLQNQIIINSGTNINRQLELSPTTRVQRKLSQDMRSRAGSFVNIDEDGRTILIRKPAKLRNIISKAETYDTLHARGRDVSL